VGRGVPVDLLQVDMTAGIDIRERMDGTAIGISAKFLDPASIDDGFFEVRMCGDN